MTAAVNIILFSLSFLNSLHGFFKRVLRFYYIKWKTFLFLPVKECYQTVFLELCAPLIGGRLAIFCESCSQTHHSCPWSCTAMREASLAKSQAEQALMKEASMKYIDLLKKNPARNVQSSLSSRNPKANEEAYNSYFLTQFTTIPAYTQDERNMQQEGQVLFKSFIYLFILNELERLSHVSQAPWLVKWPDRTCLTGCPFILCFQNGCMDVFHLAFWI